MVGRSGHNGDKKLLESMKVLMLIHFILFCYSLSSQGLMYTNDTEDKCIYMHFTLPFAPQEVIRLLIDGFLW